MTIATGASFKIQTALLIGAATLSLATADAAFAQSVSAQQVDIPAQSLAGTLNQIGRQTGSEIVFASADVRGKSGRAVRGSYTAEQALSVALQGTSLAMRRTPQGAFVIQGGPGSGESGAGSAAAVDESVDSTEIIVTARKTGERIQDVPVTVTAVTAKALEERGAVDIKDILRTVPGMSNIGTERGLSRYTIRGLSTFASSPTVGIYLDDVPLVTISTTFSGGYDPVFFDVARVEVLKGPQGTLYGGSAMGGAIKYISATPRLNQFSVDTAAGFAVTAHGSPSYNGEVVVNAPLVEDRLALRAGFYYRHDGGFIDAMPGEVQDGNTSSTPFPIYTPARRDAGTTYAQKDANFADTYVGRVSLEWQPDETWSIRPQIFYQDYKQANQGAFFLNRPGYTSSLRMREPNYDTAAIYSLNIEKDLGGVKLTSLTSKFDRKFIYKRDYSFFLGSLIDFLYAFDSPNDSTSNTHTFSQEVRLASDFGNDVPFRFLIGAFYSKQDDRLVQTVQTPGVEPIFGTDILYFGDTKTSTKQYALFGEATYTLFDRLDITAGVRLFKVDQLINAVYDGLFNGGRTTVDNKRGKEDGVNPKVGLAYRVTDDNLLYASAAKGFRPGGPNRYNINPAVCGADLAAIGRTSAPSVFESDNLWTYEAGTKNIFGNGAVMINAAAYYTKWKGIQQSIGLSCGFGFTDNIGTAEVKGAELEARIEPFDGFEIGGNAALTKTRVTEAVPGTTAQVGEELPGVPKWMATAFVGYSSQLGGDWRFDVRGEYQYQGAAGFTLNPTMLVTFSDGTVATIPDPNGFRKAFDVVNLSASFSHGKTRIGLYANNLFDKRPLLLIDQQTASDRAWSIRPRTIGVTVRQGF
jgi:outer membrane receptor protein involved in Fe transport